MFSSLPFVHLHVFYQCGPMFRIDFLGGTIWSFITHVKAQTQLVRVPSDWLLRPFDKSPQFCGHVLPLWCNMMVQAYLAYFLPQP